MMKCSVSIVTFQQKDFIRQAVESALGQDAKFPFEVIVGDDASTDGTREILAEMQIEAPERLRLLLAEANYGDYGLSNVMATVDAATGEYIAFLDGDDYWTTPTKLRRMIAFLDSHPECTIAAHRVEHVTNEGPQGLSVRPGEGDRLWDYAELLDVNFTPKSATVIRRSALAHLPEWYRTTKVASAAWLFNLLIANGGKVGFVDDVMAAHRLHDGSVTVHYGQERMLKDKLEILRTLRPLVPSQAAAFASAERRVRWKLRTVKYSPWAYGLAKRAYNAVSHRRK